MRRSALKRLVLTPEAISTTSRAMKSLKIDDLIPDPDNPRRRTARGEEVLATSFDRFGAARSIVIDKDGVVRAGNGTLEAARAAGLRKIRVVEGQPDELIAVRRADWDEQKAREYSVIDNKSAELAEWDYPVLDSLFSMPDLEPANFGFLPSEVDSIKANVKWPGVDLEAAGDVTEGKGSGEAFAAGRIEVTVLREDILEEVRQLIETATAQYARDVVVETP